MCLLFGRAYELPTAALRFFNVYGTRQALSNPYTGVLAIFGSRLLNGRPPLIFEDGQQRRDFVHVRDVARACLLALEATEAAAATPSTSAAASAARSRRWRRALARAVGRPGPAAAGHRQVPRRRHPPLLRRHHAGRRLLGFQPEEDFEAGLARARGDGGSRADCDRPGRGGDDGARRSEGWWREQLARAAPWQRPVLITGGAGFLGANLADRLARAGCRCVSSTAWRAPAWSAISRGSSSVTTGWSRRSSPTCATRTRCEEAVREAGAVFHLAAQVAVTTSLADPVDDFEINARGTLNLLEALRRRADPPPLLFASTNKVYGKLLDEAELERVRRPLAARATPRPRGLRRAHAARLPQPLWLLQGRRRPVRARLRARVRPAAPWSSG